MGSPNWVFSCSFRKHVAVCAIFATHSSEIFLKTKILVARFSLSGNSRIRQCPTLPHSHPCSTIGAEGLYFCVRDGNRCGPFAKTTGIFVTFLWEPSLLTAGSFRVSVETLNYRKTLSVLLKTRLLSENRGHHIN